MQVPALGFADVAEVAFLAGPPAFQKFSGLFRYEIERLSKCRRIRRIRITRTHTRSAAFLPPSLPSTPR